MSKNIVKYAGITICHSRGYILSILQGPQMVGGGWQPGHGDTKRKLYLRKTHFVVKEKYVEDVKQDEKSVPDVLESIMKPSGLVKEELQRILFKNPNHKNEGLHFSDVRKNPRFDQCSRASNSEPLPYIWPH